MNKAMHGGKRINAGRKLKYGEALKRLVIYCPESKTNEIKTLVRQKLISYEQEFKL